MEIFLQILFLIIGMALLIKGADFFVDGSKDVATRMRIPAVVIGLTLVSIGTSLPEASVSITSAINGANDLSFGNVVGSNIFNCFIVIGLCSMIVPMIVSKDILKYDMPILIGIMALLILFAYAITPYEISRIESGVLFATFILYLVFTFLRVRKQDNNEENETVTRKLWLSILLIILGVTGIIVGGKFVVDSAKQLALEFGMSEMLVGLTVVAVGTSLPELVTSLVAAKKGEQDIAVGNAIGSCLFNIIFILGFSGMLEPITLLKDSYIDIIFMVIAVLITFAFSVKTKKINRIEGLIMVLLYVGYLTYIIIRN